MDTELLAHLRKITDEERSILAGRDSIDRALYMQGGGNTVNSRKLLSAGKLITVRPHTRFIPFPEHTHDYVEVVYMCEGSTTHTVNGTPIDLRQGELLFLNQSALHQVSRAEETDVAVNLIVLPSFFDTALAAMLRAVGKIAAQENLQEGFRIVSNCGKNGCQSVGHWHIHILGGEQLGEKMA